MARVYELPTHLQVEDQLFGALSARQSLQLGIGLSLAYGAWDQLPWLPDELRLALAVILSIVTCVFALIRPFGRPLDQWLVAGLLFLVLPRRLVWHPVAAWLHQPSRDQADWAELELHLDWLGAGAPLEREESRSRQVRRRPCMWRWSWRKR